MQPDQRCTQEASNAEGDETLLHTDEEGFQGVLVTKRNYYDEHMAETSMKYLKGKQSLSTMPSVLWLPLGSAKLVHIPAALTFEDFAWRPLLWSWVGSTS